MALDSTSRPVSVDKLRIPAMARDHHDVIIQTGRQARLYPSPSLDRKRHRAAATPSASPKANAPVRRPIRPLSVDDMGMGSAVTAPWGGIA